MARVEKKEAKVVTPEVKVEEMMVEVTKQEGMKLVEKKAEEMRTHLVDEG